MVKAMELTPQQQTEESLVCAEGWEGCAYFIHNYVQIFDTRVGLWVPFHLWPAQVAVLRQLFEERLLVILKARQMGLTWLVLAYELWLMLFQPIMVALNFSRRETEAKELLSKDRMRGMYTRLPRWLQAQTVESNNELEFALSNESRALAFPTTAGDSYAARFGLVDEADLVPNLGDLLLALKPTIENGQLVLLSKSNKKEPESRFKAIYRAAKEKKNGYCAIFLPWMANPRRTKNWYAAECASAMAETGSLDDVWEQYPETDTQALAGKTLNKRIAPQFLERNYQEIKPAEFAPDEPQPPAIPGLVIWRKPVEGKKYVLGADPAEGNPNSDPSALCVQDEATGEEVAQLASQFEMTIFAAHINAVGLFFNRAGVLVERNNHGHTVLAELRRDSELNRLTGPDGKEGWLSSPQGKVKMYDDCTEAFRQNDTTVHSFSTFTQLGSIDGRTLRAPEGQHDDEATAYALAHLARALNHLQIWI